MDDVAAKGDGEHSPALGQAAPRRPTPGRAHRAGEVEVGLAIRCLAQLYTHHPRRREGIVDVPSRTSRTEAGNVQPGAGEPLGDVAGDVDTEEMEGNTLATRTLQRREPMAGLLERHAEAVLQNANNHFERVKELAGRKVASAEDLDEAQASLTTAEQQEKASSAGISTAKAKLAVTETEQAQIAVLDRQIAQLEAQKQAQIAERDRKQIDLEHFTINANFRGVVDSTFVDPGSTLKGRCVMSDKTGPQHRSRKAILYVRQSSVYQVQHNEESRRMQYAMETRLRELGWTEIEVIDDDLGRSAAGMVARA